MITPFQFEVVEVEVTLCNVKNDFLLLVEFLSIFMLHVFCSSHARREGFSLSSSRSTAAGLQC